MSRDVQLLEAIVVELRGLREDLRSAVEQSATPSNGAVVPTVDAEQLLNAKETAGLIHVSVRTFQRLRHLGQVPKPVQLGRVLRWRRRDIDRWLEKRSR